MRALLILVLWLAGCATAGPPATTYETCANASRCRVSGVATAAQAHGVWMAAIELAEGRCIAASLPERQISVLRRNGPTQLTIDGAVFGSPADAEHMAIDGRPIGLGFCGGAFLIYVQ